MKENLLPNHLREFWTPKKKIRLTNSLGGNAISRNSVCVVGLEEGSGAGDRSLRPVILALGREAVDGGALAELHLNGLHVLRLTPPVTKTIQRLFPQFRVPLIIIAKCDA